MVHLLHSSTYSHIHIVPQVHRLTIYRFLKLFLRKSLFSIFFLWSVLASLSAHLNAYNIEYFPTFYSVLLEFYIEYILGHTLRECCLLFCKCGTIYSSSPHPPQHLAFLPQVVHDPFVGIPLSYLAWLWFFSCSMVTYSSLMWLCSDLSSSTLLGGIPSVSGFCSFELCYNTHLRTVQFQSRRGSWMFFIPSHNFRVETQRIRKGKECAPELTEHMSVCQKFEQPLFPVIFTGRASIVTSTSEVQRLNKETDCLDFTAGEGYSQGVQPGLWFLSPSSFFYFQLYRCHQKCRHRYLNNNKKKKRK